MNHQTLSKLHSILAISLINKDNGASWEYAFGLFDAGTFLDLLEKRILIQRGKGVALSEKGLRLLKTVNLSTLDMSTEVDLKPFLAAEQRWSVWEQRITRGTQGLIVFALCVWAVYLWGRFG